MDFVLVALLWAWPVSYLFGLALLAARRSWRALLALLAAIAPHLLGLALMLSNMDSPSTATTASGMPVGTAVTLGLVAYFASWGWLVFILYRYVYVEPVRRSAGFR